MGQGQKVATLPTRHRAAHGKEHESLLSEAVLWARTRLIDNVDVESLIVL